jgi:L-ascorbate metabolism protein UlaG (beta-lactamase superfamily)
MVYNFREFWKNLFPIVLGLKLQSSNLQACKKNMTPEVTFTGSQTGVDALTLTHKHITHTHTHTHIEVHLQMHTIQIRMSKGGTAKPEM